MSITLENYEAFLLDYMESNLSAEQVAELMLFLEVHPELKEDLDDWEGLILEPIASVTFNEKEELRQTIVPVANISEDNYELYLIREVENDLSDSELKTLALFLEQNPGLQKEQRLFAATVLKPDQNVTYAGKSTLRQPVLIPFNQQKFVAWFAAAASIALLFMLLFFGDNPSSDYAAVYQQRLTVPTVHEIELDDLFAETQAPVQKSSIDEVVSIQEVAPIAVPKKEETRPREPQTPVEPEIQLAQEVQEPQPQQMTDSAKTEDYALDAPAIDSMPKVDQMPQFDLPDAPEEALAETIIPEQPSQQPTLNLKQFAIQQLKKNTIGEGEDPITLKGEELVENGVKGLNKLFAGKLRLGKSRNDKGDVVAWAFSSPGFSVSHTSGKK